jgi:2-C-methyl-D-erythritol 4-phosphate cytidylyltransferase
VTTAAVVPAAGRGERLGPDGPPKALRPVGGVPLLLHTVAALTAAGSVGLVVVAAPGERLAEVRALLSGTGATVVAGGASRQASVGACLAALPDDVDVVLVHDAARPFAPPAFIDSVAAAVRAGADAVLPVLPIVDTVKEVHGDLVTGTVDRGALRAAQTPQGFRRAVLAAAHAAAGTVDATDDAGLVEALGRPVTVIEGHPEAFKVTRPVDLLLAEALLARREGADGQRG